MTTRAQRTPRRRTVVALAVIFAVLAGFVLRLVDIQVVSAADHVADSTQNGMGTTVSLAGNRGTITDSSGTVLASSRLVYDAQLDPSLIMKLEQQTEEDKKPKVPWEEASAQIAEVTGQSTKKVQKIVADAYAQNPDSQYALLTKGLSTSQYLALQKLDLPYLAMISRAVRVYPNGAVAGNIVGFLNGDGQGQYGVEKLDSKCLAPKDGTLSYLKGRDGVRIPGSKQETPAVDGGTVQLTINSDLNWYLQQMIAEEAQRQGAKRGSVTVVEVKTGKIRAAAEWPSLDPNKVGDDPSLWNSQVFSHDYEPGSIAKPLVAATLIQEGAATPRSTVTASGRETFPNGANIGDSFPHPKYVYTLAGALIDSSNVALSKFGTKVSPQTRYDYLKKFGVGQQTSVGFPGESSGVLHPVDEWDNQSLYTTTFGQFFTTTPAQAAGAYQALGNGGKKIDLSLVESCVDSEGKEHVAKQDSERVISKKTSKKVLRMLENVAVQADYADAVKVPGYRIGTKTGTAQVADGKGGYKKGVYITSIMGVAPIEDPQYVVMVSLDEPTRITSSAATVPALQQALTQVLKTYHVAPSSTPMGDTLPKFG